MENRKIRLGITHGDINGIGYEIIIKTLMDNRMFEICTPVVYGSPKVAAYHRKALDIDNFSFNNIKTAGEAHDKRPNIINCTDENVRVELGKSSSMAGEASYHALKAAVRDLQENQIDALVTAPINKHNIQSSEFKYSGHTEFFQSAFNADEVLMLLVSPLMKVGVVAGHIPMRDLPDFITKNRVLKKIRVLNESLKKDFGVRKPKIAVLGLNPHSGDNGLIGNEEIDHIIPAIEEAKNNNILVMGPYPADGFFGSGSFVKFDAVLAMYHDQGLTPFKTLVIDEGVNYTAGLPIIRTSPAHGTAYEISGKNEAKFGSFRQAIYMACDIYKNRNMYDEITKNPLSGDLPDDLKGSKEVSLE